MSFLGHWKYHALILVVSRVLAVAVVYSFIRARTHELAPSNRPRFFLVVVAPQLKPRKARNDQLNETRSALMHSLAGCLLAGITYRLYDSRNYPQITQLVPMCAHFAFPLLSSSSHVPPYPLPFSVYLLVGITTASVRYNNTVTITTERTQFAPYSLLASLFLFPTIEVCTKKRKMVGGREGGKEETGRRTLQGYTRRSIPDEWSRPRRKWRFAHFRASLFFDLTGRFNARVERSKKS